MTEFKILKQEILNVFEDNGPFKEVFPSYKKRPDQVTMALTIGEALTKNKVAIIEAGTGTGKSFGELIPTLLYILKEGKRAFVVTHTIALQQQLFYKDIPVMKKLLKLVNYPDFNAVLLKGKGNFICYKKIKKEFEKAKNQKNDYKFYGELKKLLKDISDEHGNLIKFDKDKLSFKPDDDFWTLISPNQDDNCNDCPYKKECYFMKNKEEAKNADIIIGNHSLLIADLVSRQKNGYKENGGIVPDYDVVVIDEAHHIEEVASEFIGLKTDTSSLLKITNFITKKIYELSELEDFKTLITEKRKKYIYSLSKNIEKEINNIVEKYEETKKIKSPCFSVEKKFFEKINFDSFHKFNEIILFLVEKMETIQNNNENIEKLKTLKRFLNMFSSLKNNFVEISKVDEEENFVYWCYPEKETITFKKTPIDIAPFLKESLFERNNVVLASATIKFDQGLGFFAKKIGNLNEEDFLSVCMNSPFDYEKQACFYIPAQAVKPEKDDDGEDKLYDEYSMKEIMDLIKLSKGRAFVLFTSYKTMQRYYQELAPKIEKMGYPVLMQGQKDRNKLVEEFKKAGNAVLFGADSFWEGIDIPGRELSLVIVHKIPFAVPNPLLEAKMRKVKAVGGNPFLEVLVYSAVTKYKQGFGRLIRTINDKGVFCLLDPRIVDKTKKERYGKYFINALPNMYKTVNKKDLIQFLE